MTLSGEGLLGDGSGTPTVYVDGVEATVVWAEDHAIAIRPGLRVDEPGPAVIDVEVSNQMSNGLMFELVPSGTARPAPTGLPPTAVDAVEVDGVVYVAAPAFAAGNGGLYAVGPDGWISQLWEAPEADLGAVYGAEGSLALFDAVYDGPVALARYGDDVLMATATGAIRRYDTATGRVSDALWWVYATPADDWSAIRDFDVSGHHAYVLDLYGNLEAFDLESGMAEYLGYDSDWHYVVSDGPSLYLTNGFFVDVIENPGRPAEAFLTDWAYLPEWGSAMAVVGSELVVATETELQSIALHVVGVDDGGPTGQWGDPAGYGYATMGMSATAEGDLYLAQTDAGVVRRIDAGQTAAVNVAPAMRIHFGTALDGDSTYLTSIGVGVFGQQPGWEPDSIVDGFVIELRDGAARILHETTFPTGIAVKDNVELYVSDCFEGTIDTVNRWTGKATLLVDGLKCAADLKVAGNDLLYANASLPEEGPSTVGRLYKDGTNDPAFVTKLPSLTTALDVKGDLLVSAQLALGGFDGGSGVYTAPLATGGPATRAIPGGAAGMLLALGTSPDGAVIGSRYPFGDLVRLDVMTGEVIEFGSTDVGWFNPYAYESSPTSGAMSFDFAPDGTIVAVDIGQAALVQVAP